MLHKTCRLAGCCSRRVAWKWFIAAMVIALLALTLWRFDSQSLLHSLRHIPLWLMALLLGLQIISQLLVNTLWHSIAKLTNTPISFGKMFKINSQGAVVDAITPGVKFGGEVTRGVQIKRVANCDGTQAATLVVLQKLFSLTAFFFALLFAIGTLTRQVPVLQAWATQMLFYGVSLALLLLFLGILLAPQAAQSYIQKRNALRFAWARKLRGFVLTLLTQVEAVGKHRMQLTALFGLSLLIWLLYPLKLYLLVVQFAPDISIVYIAAIAFVAYMVAMLPIFPGGLGGFEGTMTALLAVFGLAAGDAAVTTILFRFVTFWFVMLMGLAVIAVGKAAQHMRRQR